MNFMTDIEAIQAVEHLNGKPFSDEQKAILQTQGGLSIAAIAGGGKTTILTALITKRILTGEIADPSKVLCTTFSKTGAVELESRLASLTGPLGLPSVKVSTIHSTCFQILKHFGVNINLLTETENMKLLQQAVSQAVGRKVYLDRDKIEQLENTIGIMDGALMTIDELFRSGKYLLDYDKKTFENIANIYKVLKRSLNKFTFDDLLTGVYEWLCVAKVEAVLQYVRSTYRYLYLDEFQDTNKVQFEVIKAILNMDPAAKPEQRLVVVGDDDQNVYEWRGTDPRIMIDIRSVVDIKKMNLSTNYRCRKNIVDSAMNCVVNMGTRQDKTMQAYNSGGKVELLDSSIIDTSVKYTNYICKNSRLVADRIYTEITKEENGIIGEGHYCIMARTNAEMAIIANMLFRQGILVRQTAGMQISKKSAWASVKQIIELSRPFNGTYRLKGILYQLVPYASSRLEELINDVIVTCQCSIDYAIEYILLNYAEKTEIEHYIKENLRPGQESNAGKGQIAIDLNLRLQSNIEYVLDNFKNLLLLTNFVNAIRDKQSLKALLNLWNSCLAEQTPRLNLAFKEYLTDICNTLEPSELDNFIRATEQAESNSNCTTYDKRIELRTIHSSKGMEWNVVYILNDDNYSFPDFYKLKNIESQDVSYATLKNVVDSERRLHYVAQTRARNELYFVCNRKYASVFLEETFGYKYKTPQDSLLAARLRNANCNDENGRIIFKAHDLDFMAKELKAVTLIENK